MPKKRSNAAQVTAIEEFRRRDAKAIIPDTSVPMHDPASIKKLQPDNVVVLTWPLLEELDNHKSRGDLHGWNAREAIRNIEHYREMGNLHEGVRTKEGGLIVVEHSYLSMKGLPQGTDKSKRDNLFLAAGKTWYEKMGFKNTCLISKDTNLRIKASVLGIPTADYWDDKIKVPVERLNTGLAQLTIERAAADSFFQRLHTQKDGVPADEIESELPDLYCNQCCIIQDPSGRYQLALYKVNQNGEGYFRLVEKPVKDGKGVRPKNDEQAFAYALLKDPEIFLVTLAGRAGTGKTLISILAADEMLNEEKFKQIAIYRPAVTIGKDLGSLPGEIRDKFEPWMAPIADNFAILKNGDFSGKAAEFKGLPAEQRNGKYNPSPLQGLMEAGILEISPLSYLRGRTFHKKIVIVDDTQNLTPHETKAAITRAGAGTKFVLTGDYEQIDNRYLDAMSNGFSHVIDRFKGQRGYGHITLIKSERSELAELAAKLL